MITLHGEEVKVGDRVWHWVKGWGEVDEIEERRANYPICVRWEDGCEWFTEDGKAYTEEETPILFWQPVKFEIPKKPKPKEKAWQWICEYEGRYWITYSYYASKEALIERNSNAVPIEPYLPSEIEREVKE